MYTVDLDLNNMYKVCQKNDKFDNSHHTLVEKKKKRVLDRLKRNKLKKDIL